MDRREAGLSGGAWTEDDLVPLLDELRGAGFTVGVEEVLRVLEAARASRAAGGGDDPLRLRNYLAPVVCTNAGEQADFYHRFAEWWRRRGGREEDAGALEPPPPLERREVHGQVVRTTRPWKWRLAGVAALLVILVLCVALFVIVDSRTTTHVDATAGGTPGGVEAPGFEAPPENGRPSPVEDVSPLATRWPSVVLAHEPEIRTAVAVAPLLAALTWLLWRRRRRQLVVERRTTRGRQAREGVGLPEPSHGLYRGAGFARVAVEARRRRAAGRGELDSDATVDASAEQLGWFTPVYRRRLEMPVYLALVDRAGLHDQAARRVDELLDRLESDGVALERYDFDRDPRLCRPHRGGPQRDLRELAGLHRGCRLLVFSDGAGLVHPLSGHPDRFVDLFAAWPARALLSPVPAGRWTRREVDLAATGFTVLPGTPAGLERFVAVLDQPTADAEPPHDAWRPPGPELLARCPERWLERDAPPDAEIDALCRELRVYLGAAGYRWLAALAVYPELDWHLTLYLGLRLKRADGSAVLDEPTLIDLTRLVWLRRGTLPDWLRLRLMRDLSTDDEREIRDFLRDLLEMKLETPGSRFRLDVTRRGPDKDRDWKQLLVDLFRTEPDDSPLHDHVFVSFLLGKSPKKLQLLAPGNWRRFIYERGLVGLGLRPAVVFVLALLGAAGLGGPVLDVLEPYVVLAELDMRFRFIPARSFQMGSPIEEAGRFDNETLHGVTLARRFEMGETEVTQAQWQRLMGNNPSRFFGCGGDCPVERVSWWGAVAFANALSRRMGLEECYDLSGCGEKAEGPIFGRPVADSELFEPASDNPFLNVTSYQCDEVSFKGLDCPGYRLPTEAEWEYAARAGTSTPFWTGENLTTDQANYDGNYPYVGHPRGEYRQATVPVKSFAPNPWGLYEVHGNVWEWVADWYGTYPAEAVEDPTGAERGSLRVLRGGSWFNGARYCRSACRSTNAPGGRRDDVGCRVVRTLP